MGNPSEEASQGAGESAPAPVQVQLSLDLPPGMRVRVTAAAVKTPAGLPAPAAGPGRSRQAPAGTGLLAVFFHPNRAGAEAQGGDLRAKIMEAGPWLWAHRWALSLGAIAIFMLFYLALGRPLDASTAYPQDPGVPGRPFYELHALRQGLSDHYGTLGWLLALAGWAVTTIFLVIGLRRPQGEGRRRWAQLSLLAAALTLAALGQWSFGILPLNADQPRLVPALLLYALAILGFAGWAWLRRASLGQALRPEAISSQGALLLRLDWLIFLGVFLLAALTRLWAFPQLPYGVEGDEKNWTAEVILLKVDGRSDPSGDYHYGAVPTSFLMQAPFHTLFGAGIPAARLAVVFFSLLGGLAFFWLLHQTAPLPLAALASFLLAVSIADISASRLANVESHVKLWPLLALALLAFALKLPGTGEEAGEPAPGASSDRWWAYLLAGGALAAGVLTYDTVWPLAPLLALLLAIELLLRKMGWKAVLLREGLLFAPLLPALPSLWEYLGSRLPYYEIGEKWSQGLGALLLPRLVRWLGTWFCTTWGDFIYSRPTGPMLNALLNPFLVLGLVVALFSLRRVTSRWMLLWAGAFFVPVPMLANSPLARVYYPGLPAAYALAALGLFAMLRELAQAAGPAESAPSAPGRTALFRKFKQPALLGLAAAGLALYSAFNLYIYFNEVSDPDNRQMIRETGEFIHQGSAPGVRWLIPYLPGANSQLYAEDRTIEIYMHGKLPPDQIPAAHQRLPFAEFLPVLAATLQAGTPVEVLLDKATPEQAEPRQAAAGVLGRCFPAGRLYPGRFMDRYSLSPADLDGAACLPVLLELSGIGIPGEADFRLAWKLSAGTASLTRLACEQERADAAWIELEKTAGLGGWTPDNLMILGWLGDGFVYDNFGGSPMMVKAALAGEGPAYAWVRFYKRLADQAPGRVEAAGQALPFAQGGADQLNRWVWERVGPFWLPAGQRSAWSISRLLKENQSGFVSLFVDALVLTSNPAFSPESDSTWRADMERAAVFEAPESSGEISLEGITSGRQRCRLGVESPQPLVDAFGQSPVWSSWLEFEIP